MVLRRYLTVFLISLAFAFGAIYGCGLYETTTRFSHIGSGHRKIGVSVFISDRELRNSYNEIPTSFATRVRYGSSLCPAKWFEEGLKKSVRKIFNLVRSPQLCDLMLMPEITDFNLKRLKIKKYYSRPFHGVRITYECSISTRISVSYQGRTILRLEKSEYAAETSESESQFHKSDLLAELADSDAKAKAVDSALKKTLEYYVGALSSSQLIAKIERDIYQKKSSPSNLLLQAVYKENKAFLPNNTIDAGESCEIDVTLKNEGKGTAFDVKVLVECKSKGLTFPKSIDVGDIQPGGSKELTIPVKADLSLETGTASFLIKAREKRGYDARPVELQIPTARLRSPKLMFASCNLNDSSGLGVGDGDNTPENNETIEIDPYVRNQGEGEALKVKVSLVRVTEGIEVVKGSDELASIEPGAMGKAALAFKIPRTFSGHEIKYTILATDIRGMKAERTYTIPFEPKAPVLYYTYRVVDNQNKEIPALENGSSYRLKIIPKNTGNNIAQGVRVKVTAGSSGIYIGSYDGDVGRLEPGGIGSMLVVPVTLDRSYVLPSLTLDVTMDQDGFPGYSRKITLPVMVRKPKLSYDVALLNGVSERNVSQNSWPRFRVSVSNNGNLDAKDVKVRFSVSGGNVSFDKDETIGTIKAGESQYKDFTFFVRGDAPLGKLNVDVKISQADFEPMSNSFAYRITEQRAIVKKVKAVGGSRVSYAAGGYSGPPELYINSPNRDTKTFKEMIDLHGSIMTFGRGNGIEKLSIMLNNKPLTIIPVTEEIRLEPNQITRRVVEGNKVIFDGAVKLRPGVNEIKIVCVDRNNERAEKTIKVMKRARLGNIYALVVGISEFANQGYNLRYAASDAEKFYEFLRSDYGGKLSRDRVKLLTDSSATRAAVIGALTNFLGRATREDTVEIYIATHGVTDVDGTLYYLCYDTDLTNLAGTGFSDNDLTRILNKHIKAGKIVLYLDACHSGLSGLSERFAKRSIGIYEVNERINSLAAALSKKATTGVACFSASSSTGASLEDEKWQGGVFTYCLVKGLKGEANEDRDEWVTIEELDRYLVRKVMALTQGKQRPKMNSTLVGDIPLSKVR